MNIKNNLRTLTLVLVSILGSSFGVNAQQGDPILLTVSGEALTTQEFNFDTLSSMASIKFETTTIWTDGLQSFEGIPLKLLLAKVGVTKGEISATAVNDYAIEIPMSEISDEAPIVAYRQNGKLMSLRDKGPLWLVYPYDKSTKFQTEVIYSRSIWQLDRIQVK